MLAFTFGPGVFLGALKPLRNIQPRQRMSSRPTIEIYIDLVLLLSTIECTFFCQNSDISAFSMDRNFATTWTQKSNKVSGTISWSSSVDCAGLIACTGSAAFENNNNVGIFENTTLAFLKIWIFGYFLGSSYYR